MLVLTFHNPRFIQILSAAIKFGKKVLIENVGEDIDRSLYPLFNKTMLLKERSSQSIFLQGVPVAIHANFELNITTEIKNPRFQAEIAVFANFINFSVTRAGLEAQLLSYIVAEKMARLEKKFVLNKIKALDCFVKLQTMENLILESLNQEVDLVLNDDLLVEHLSNSNISSKNVTKGSIVKEARLGSA